MKPKIFDLLIRRLGANVLLGLLMAMIFALLPSAESSANSSTFTRSTGYTIDTACFTNGVYHFSTTESDPAYNLMIHFTGAADSETKFTAQENQTFSWKAGGEMQIFTTKGYVIKKVLVYNSSDETALPTGVTAKANSVTAITPVWIAKGKNADGTDNANETSARIKVTPEGNPTGAAAYRTVSFKNEGADITVSRIVVEFEKPTIGGQSVQTTWNVNVAGVGGKTAFNSTDNLTIYNKVNGQKEPIRLTWSELSADGQGGLYAQSDGTVKMYPAANFTISTTTGTTIKSVKMHCSAYGAGSGDMLTAAVNSGTAATWQAKATADGGDEKTFEMDLSQVSGGCTSFTVTNNTDSKQLSFSQIEIVYQTSVSTAAALVEISLNDEDLSSKGATVGNTTTPKTLTMQQNTPLSSPQWDVAWGSVTNVSNQRGSLEVIYGSDVLTSGDNAWWMQVTKQGTALVRLQNPENIYVKDASGNTQPYGETLYLITVSAPKTGVVISADNVSLIEGQTSQITATTKDTDGSDLSGLTLTYASDNTAVATVSASGLITAVAEGETEIVISYAGDATHEKAEKRITVIVTGKTNITLSASDIVFKTSEASADHPIIIKAVDGNGNQVDVSTLSLSYELQAVTGSDTQGFSLVDITTGDYSGHKGIAYSGTTAKDVKVVVSSAATSYYNTATVTLTVRVTAKTPTEIRVYYKKKRSQGGRQLQDNEVMYVRQHTNWNKVYVEIWTTGNNAACIGEDDGTGGDNESVKHKMWARIAKKANSETAEGFWMSDESVAKLDGNPGDRHIATHKDNGSATIRIDFAGDDTYAPSMKIANITALAAVPEVDVVPQNEEGNEIKFAVNKGKDTEWTDNTTEIYFTLDGSDPCDVQRRESGGGWIAPETSKDKLIVNGTEKEVSYWLNSKGGHVYRYSGKENTGFGFQYGDRITLKDTRIVNVAALGDTWKDKYSAGGYDTYSSGNKTFRYYWSTASNYVYVKGLTTKSWTFAKGQHPGDGKHAEENPTVFTQDLLDSDGSLLVKMTLGNTPSSAWTTLNGNASKTLWHEASADEDGDGIIKNAKFGNFTYSCMGQNFDGTNERQMNSSPTSLSTYSDEIGIGTSKNKCKGGQYLNRLTNNEFDLPVRGSYLQFEAKKNGLLFVFVRQNGGPLTTTLKKGNTWTFPDGGAVYDASSKDKSGVPDITKLRKRYVFVADETGTAQRMGFDTYTYKDVEDMPEVKAYLSSRGRVNDKLLLQFTPKNIRCGAGLDTTLNDPTATTNNADVDLSIDNLYYYYNWVKGTSLVKGTDAWPGWNNSSEERTHEQNHLRIVKNDGQIAGFGVADNAWLKNSCHIMSKGFVCYEIPVMAGKTYFVMGNTTKVGLSGFMFQKNTVEGSQATQEIFYRADGSVVGGDMYGSAFQPQGGRQYHITLERTFESGVWASLVLPFSVSESKLKEVFGDSVLVEHFHKVEGTTIWHMKHMHQMIVAGTPILIRPSKDVYNPRFSDTTWDVTSSVWSGSDKDQNISDKSPNASGEWTIKGSFSSMTCPEGDYYLNTAGQWRRAKKATTLKPTRCYMHYRGTQQSAPMLQSVGSFEAEQTDESSAATAIEGISEDELGGLSESADVKRILGVYTLQGVLLGDRAVFEALPKGVYIVNGRKVVKK